MITRDFLMRQVHQLVQAVARAVFFRRAGDFEDAEGLIARTVQDVTGLEPSRLRTLSRSALLALCAPDPDADPPASEISSEKAVALGDLLCEDARLLERREDDAAARAGRERALWLYEGALRSGGAIPIDLPMRMQDLRDLLEPAGR